MRQFELLPICKFFVVVRKNNYICIEIKTMHYE